MTEPRVFLSIYVPLSIRDAVAAEAVLRTAASGTPISAARIMREAVVNALGLPIPDMPQGRPRKVGQEGVARLRNRTVQSAKMQENSSCP